MGIVTDYTVLHRDRDVLEDILRSTVIHDADDADSAADEFVRFNPDQYILDIFPGSLSYETAPVAHGGALV